MALKGYIPSVTVIMLIVIGLVWTITLIYVTLKPYEKGTDYLKSEAARLNALNIAGVISMMNSRPDSEYTFTVELDECEIWIFQTLVQIKSHEQLGKAYMDDTSVARITPGHFLCFADKKTRLFFKKTNDSITLTRLESDNNAAT